MKRLSILAGACAMLAACGGGTSTGGKTVAICTTMLSGDAEVESDLSARDMSVADYCACYAEGLNAQSAEDKAAILKVTQILADLREERGLGLEEAADLLDDSGAEAEFSLTRAEFETAGEYVDTIRRDLVRDEGLCAS
ncbi:hypothetical protein [uncultured Hyphomonas sp.]|uniref:hypothetical protein n=1 Tax=uncultured Hyphomonas sp. TaxID=225298 RepID=UPI002AAB6DF0|nr:hypothetical protein [uncultured Hyphomonas sp.]